MAETYPSDADLAAKSGGTGDTGIPHMTTGQTPHFVNKLKRSDWLDRALYAIANGLRVFKDADLTFGVAPGRHLNGGTAVNYAGAAAQALTNNQTNYIYLTAAGALTVNITGFPAASTPHLPLATILTAAGVYAHSDIVDYRGRAVFGASSDLTSAEMTAMHGRYAVRPAALAVGAVYFAGRPADADLLTIGGRKYEYDSDSTFPESAGDVIIDANAAANVDDDITASAAAINGDGSATVDAVADLVNDVLWLYAKTAGAAGNAITLVTALANTTASDATLADGADAAVAAIAAIRHTITAAEAAGGFLRFDTSLTSIESIAATYEDAANEVASQADVTVAGGVIALAETGGLAWATGDVINLIAIGTE